MDYFGVYVFVFFGILGDTFGQTIDTAPQDVSLLVGEDVTLPCEITTGTDTFFVWQRRDTQGESRVIYSKYGDTPGKISEDLDANKYDVPSQGSEVGLTINSIELIDGDRYECAFISPEVVELASVVILGTPIVTTTPDAIFDGDEVQVTCDAEYGAGRLSSDSQQLPTVHLFLTQEIPSETAPVRTDGDPGVSPPSTLKGTWNITLTAADNGKNLTCELQSFVPTTSVTTRSTGFLTLNIEYIVKDVVITTAEDYVLRFNSYINCSASGNPEPSSYQWYKNDNRDTVVGTGQALQISQTIFFLDETCTLTCVARNVIQGIPHEAEAQTGEFTIAAPIDDGNTGGNTDGGGDDGWKIAVGVTVPIVLIVIGGIVGLVVFTKFRKNKDSGKGQSSYSGTNASGHGGSANDVARSTTELSPTSGGKGKKDKKNNKNISFEDEGNGVNQNPAYDRSMEGEVDINPTYTTKPAYRDSNVDSYRDSYEAPAHGHMGPEHGQYPVSHAQIPAEQPQYDQPQYDVADIERYDQDQQQQQPPPQPQDQQNYDHPAPRPSPRGYRPPNQHQPDTMV